MMIRRLHPATPPLSPLAEIVNTFEETDPDACRLLRPIKEGLTRGELEVRARREFPERTPDERDAIASRAEELMSLVDRSDAPVEPRHFPAHAPLVADAEKDRRIGLLVEAVINNPALTAQEGYELLTRDRGVRVPKGTFYGAYWKRALERTPDAVLQLRAAMTAPRPGKKKVKTSPEDRVRVVEAVSELIRRHPGWHPGQIMDEVRRITGIEFRDPIAFRRHYIDRVQATAPGGSAAEGPATPILPDQPHDVVAADHEDGADTPVDLIAVVRNQAPPEVGRDEDLLGSLLAGADPLRPAELVEADGGGVALKLTLRPSALARAYRVMSLLYGELASRHEQAPRSA